MIIDIVFAILLLMAVIKGYSRGFIIAVFSVIGLMAGLAAAIKLSAIAAEYLKDSVNVSSKWLPVISFVLVFLAALLLVRLGAKAIEKVVEIAMLGWLNRLAGILLYGVLYIVIFSVILFYVEKVHLLSQETLISSRTHSFVQPLGPKAIELLGYVIPFFKNMFHDLQTFFDTLARHRK